MKNSLNCCRFVHDGLVFEAGNVENAVVCGRRIIDVELVLDRCCHGCCDCAAFLNIVNTIDEDLNGFASIFHVKCQSCETVNFVQTAKTVVSRNGKRRVYNVNVKATLGE